MARAPSNLAVYSSVVPSLRPAQGLRALPIACGRAFGPWLWQSGRWGPPRRRVARRERRPIPPRAMLYQVCGVQSTEQPGGVQLGGLPERADAPSKRLGAMRAMLRGSG